MTQRNSIGSMLIHTELPVYSVWTIFARRATARAGQANWVTVKSLKKKQTKGEDKFYEFTLAQDVSILYS